MECIRSYAMPKRIMGRMNKTDPILPSIICHDEETGAFSIQTGLGL
jgi:hypothetical protein